VASAGNESGAVDAPGNCSGVLAVAGLRNVGTKVGYSSFGPEVGVAAPAGNCVISFAPPCLRSIDTTVNLGLTAPAGNGYTNMTDAPYNLGTSFSAPIVSGIAALMRAVNANLTPAQLIARIEASATAFPQPAKLPSCSATSADGAGECACVRGQCGAGMVNALNAVTAALAPIAVITSGGSSTAFNAGGSVAACNHTIASYAWTASGGIAIQGAGNGPQVTVASTGSTGTLTLTVADSAGHTDTGTVSFGPSGAATVNAPSSAGTAATACVPSMTVAPAAPTISETFAPASVAENAAATLTITFNNPNGYALTRSGFTETLPAQLSLQTSPAPTTTCAGASGTLSSSANAVTMAGANIPAKGNCSITLSVKSAAAGSYSNSIAVNALSTGPAGGNSAGASAALDVTAPSKSGGGSLDWLDMMFVVGVLLAGRRHGRRRPPQ
jgi:serine protease